MRFLANRPINLSRTFFEDDEETPLTLAGVTVTLSDWQGNRIASEDAVNNGDVWSVSFAGQALGSYVASWDTGNWTEGETVEVVGSFLFSVPQARASDSYLTDKAAFPSDEIRKYREVVEAEFERITSRSFTTRIAERRFVADESPEFVSLIPDAQRVESVSINGTRVDDISGWSVTPMGKVIAPTGATHDGDALIVRIRYGFTHAPADVSRAGTIRLRSLLAAEDSGIPDRATTWQPQEGGTFRLATPGQGKWRTGIPEVDSTLKNYALDAVLAVYGVG